MDADAMNGKRADAGLVGPVEDARLSRLMARAQGGDQDAYRCLLEGVLPYVRALCARCVEDEDDVEDVVQEILLTLHSIRHTYQPGRPFKPWLYTIAMRRIADWQRGVTRRCATAEAAAPATAGPAVEGEPPDGHAIRGQRTAALRRAIAQLPPSQREAVTLLQVRDLRAREAAQATGKSAGALKVACHRAMRALHSALVGGRQ